MVGRMLFINSGDSIACIVCSVALVCLYFRVDVTFIYGCLCYGHSSVVGSTCCCGIGILVGRHWF